MGRGRSALSTSLARRMQRVNESERMLKLSEFRGIHIWEATEVLLKMYADDKVLVGETIIQL